MLTSRQRARCAEIAAALDAGDLRPWREAEARMTAEEKGAMWDMRQEQVKKNLTANLSKGLSARAETELRPFDLDDWPLASQEPDDDDGLPGAPVDDDEPEPADDEKDEEDEEEAVEDWVDAL
jgi:hypothetical protein